MSQNLFSQKATYFSTIGSDIRRMFLLGQDLKKQNPNIDLIDLSLGNPDLEPPSSLKETLTKLTRDSEKGVHRYMDNAGLLATREFLAKKLSQECNVKVTADSVFMTCGAAGGIQIVLRTVLDPGDEVLIFKPYFVEYIPYTLQMDGKTIEVECDENHLPCLQDLERKITARTRVAFINSPNNPSGVVYPAEHLKKMAEIFTKASARFGRPIHLISDEPYTRIAFKNVEVASILQFYQPSWVIRSHSKDLGLAGERIGFIAWTNPLNTPETLALMRSSARAIGFPNAPALMQRLLPVAYDLRVEVDEYQKRAELFVRILREGGLSVVSPGGTFFVLPKCPIADDVEFCEKLVKNGVLCVPGRGFGVPGYFRASLTQPLKEIERAAKKIVQLSS